VRRRTELVRAGAILLGFMIATTLDQTLALAVPLSGKVVGTGADAAYIRGKELLQGKDWYQLLRLAGYLPTWIVAASVLAMAGWAAGRRGEVGAGARGAARGVLLVLGTGCSGLAAEVLRVLFRRERPGASGLYVWDWPWGPKPPSGWGLPSSHAAVAFGAAFVLVNLPFFALALWRMGWRFTAKTAVAVVLLAAVAEIQRPLLAIGAVQPAWAALVGGLLLGIALLILFRHRGSLGGFNVLVLYLQERFGWRAGWVQLGLDAAILLSSLVVVAPSIVALSLLGALALNLTLAVNHRPGRYMAV